MNLAELANRIETLDVLIACIVGLVAWGGVNAIGLRLLARHLSARNDEGKPQWSFATAQAGIRLLATLSGIAVGVATVYLITF